MSIELRLGGARTESRGDGRRTWHSFSFGEHYDPDNLAFAAMNAHNDEHLDGGAGYDPHRHADTEIVTWVLEGALRHRDSTGYSAVLGPGDVLRTSAGSGVEHSEVAEPGVPTRFLQTWLRPDTSGAAPSYAATTVPDGPGLHPVVGPGTEVSLDVARASLYVGRLGPAEVALPEARRLHLFVVDGEVALGDRTLRPGDAARLADEGGRALRVETDVLISVWAFDPS